MTIASEKGSKWVQKNVDINKQSKNFSSDNQIDDDFEINKSYKPTKTRFLVCALAMISLATSMMSRSVINYCITSMVDPRMLLRNKTTVSGDGSCPAHSTIFLQERLNQTVVEKNEQMNDKLNFNIVLYNNDTKVAGRSTLNREDLQPERVEEDKFMWTIEQQSYILGGFYYSYVIFMIPGGRIAELYGAKYVLLLAVAGSGIINLLTPLMARYSLSLLIASQILMGAFQSSVYPAMYALISRWLTMGEASIYTPMIKMNLRLGQVLASLVPGLILEWSNVFYVVGSIGIVWSILWLCIATSEPSTNRWVNDAELAHIMKDKKRKNLRNDKSTEPHVNGDSSENDSGRRKTPWLNIITSPSVIGLTIVKLTCNLCLGFLTVELASYLGYVHHASVQQISTITTPMFAIQVSMALFVGWLAKFMVQTRPLGLTKTSIRKIFESIASIGGGTLLILIIFNNCNLTYVTIDLMIISFVSIFLVAGDGMLPYDLSEEYPATIMAIANSGANFAGIIVTTLTSLILGDQGGSQVRWHRVIAIIGGADILGGLLFCLMIKAEPIDFDSKPKSALATAAAVVSAEDGERNPTNGSELVVAVNGKVVDQTNR